MFLLIVNGVVFVIRMFIKCLPRNTYLKSLSNRIEICAQQHKFEILFQIRNNENTSWTVSDISLHKYVSMKSIKLQLLKQRNAQPLLKLVILLKVLRFLRPDWRLIGIDNFSSQTIVVVGMDPNIQTFYVQYLHCGSFACLDPHL